MLIALGDKKPQVAQSAWVAPTAVLLLVCLVPRARAWALQAAVASALASVALVVFVFGGITLITAMLSDPA